MSTQLGADIRALRRSRNMTLQAVTSVIGRSPAWLSLIERDLTRPSIGDLELIAQVFDVSISFFFRSEAQDPREQGVVVRAARRARLGSDESGLVEELLSPTLGGGFQMIRSVFAPRASSGGPRRRRPKEDGGVLVAGRLTLCIGDRRFDLETGDSFQFSDDTYEWENPHDQPAEVIWVISPPVY
ncbi:XRE family transcriptional regulator [Pseudooceanicola sp. CBS1P-1]|uniref:Helix-turn-helix domain-containing protein n=1 Tax=Pseudooceanicola albus TaxID=2692189 RepID=A0A6L7G401_9RHOB|nr:MULTISPECIES: XRE family transcriptional regulator [Pseudooceanicola]MBT9385410.1 XRE family transcriptional regulator [Pseudooceanicola endophyticus]MXN18731.1 helix-turn-helix domain-containing protein [Pseudooceanicola albus]